MRDRRTTLGVAPLPSKREGGARRKVWAIALTAMLAGTVGCGTGTGDGGEDSGASPSASWVPPEAHHLLLDGSVPWVDEPISDQELLGGPRPPRAPSPGSTSCRAGQLTGVLREWRRPGNAGETPRGFDAAIDKLIGEVEVRNTSPDECTLQGETPTRMLVDGREVPMLYVHGINEEARARVVVVPPGGRASLRLDWSGPLCADLDGALELAIDLPHRGGTLRAPIEPNETPKCRGAEVKPNVRGTLYASGFSEPAEITPPTDSLINRLSVTVSGPATASAGQPLTYQVVLANPTGKPIPLKPCPGFLVELFSQGDAKVEAVNTRQLYRLNCRRVQYIPSRKSATYQMVAQVPAGMVPGRELSITWKLMLPNFNQGPKQWGLLRVRIA